MLVFWLAAAATSTFTYRDICDACHWDGVYFDGFFHSCSGVPFEGEDGYIYTRDVSPLPRGLPGMEKRAGQVRLPRGKRGTALGRTALDAIMTCVFSPKLSSIKLIQTTQYSLRHHFSGNNLVGHYTAETFRHSCSHDETTRARRIRSSHDFDSTAGPGQFQPTDAARSVLCGSRSTAAAAAGTEV